MQVFGHFAGVMDKYPKMLNCLQQLITGKSTSRQSRFRTRGVSWLVRYFRLVIQDDRFNKLLHCATVHVQGLLIYHMSFNQRKAKLVKRAFYQPNQIFLDWTAEVSIIYNLSVVHREHLVVAEFVNHVQSIVYCIHVSRYLYYC